MFQGDEKSREKTVEDSEEYQAKDLRKGSAWFLKKSRHNDV